ncbi:MAG: type II secretion system F family protein [Candidatus Aenigmarchaeota archaeon]|nr:type II secretion system F family protein [Candidatus Aenigmarchaeota archaeon]MBU5689104.1 type II secretion system F family protein [Candidatus Aenigmarchaeota archaeon]
MVEMNTIPFLPMPLQQAKKIAKPFYGFGKKLSKLFPTLGIQLDRCEINADAGEYLSIACFAGIFWFFLVFSILFIISKTFSLSLALNLHILFSFILGFVVTFNIIMYPNVLVEKKVREIEKNLLFALRHLQIQIKSGVTLFDSLVSVANADYGLVSEEFKKAIKKISTGTPEIDSLEELAVKNPSLYFRRAIWQITNSMRSGSDLGDTLSAMVSSLSNEQRIAIRRYGSQLNPLAMMYMMTAVIIPNLGITFLLILSSFVSIGINEQTFWLILFAVAVFQFSFIGMIKNRRPAMEI